MSFIIVLAVCPKRVCISTVGVRKDLFGRDPYTVPITDFFGALRPIELTTNSLYIPLPENIIEDNMTSVINSIKSNPSWKLGFAEQFPVNIK